MSTPLVSIGMPAYNSAGTIRESLDCLLAQDYPNIEIVVSDNASTDDTWSILQAYAERDSRIVILRQARNIGANGNYSAVVHAARGRYFKWASSNDWCAPEFVSECIDVLEKRTDVVLVAPRTRLFQRSIEDGRDYGADIPFDDEAALQRFRDVTTRLRLNNVLNGVVRIDALRRTRLIEHFRGADVVLLGHLALLGKIVLLDAAHFGRRMDQQTATALMPAEAVHRHHYPYKTWRSLFPGFRHAAGCARAVLDSDLSPADKVRGLIWVGRLLRWTGPELGREFVDALRYPLR